MRKVRKVTERWSLGGKATLVCALVLSAVGCKTGEKPTSAAPPLTSSAAAPASASSASLGDEALRFAHEYPKASWRLTELDLRKLCISASRVLISFKGATADGLVYPLRLRPQARSEDEAARIAGRLAATLEQRPGDFEKTAQELSDDLTTAAWGGMLGAARGDQVPEAFVDALADVPPGSVVHSVLRTNAGFHVLKSNPPLARGSYRALRAVISYKGARAARPAQLSREAARAAAETVRRKAVGERTQFARWLLDHSVVEAETKPRNVDMHARQSFPLRAVIAGKLDRGEVSQIIETDEGFEVLKGLAVDGSPVEREPGLVFEIPNPPKRTMRDFVMLMSSADLARKTRELRSYVLADARLRHDRLGQVTTVVGSALGDLADAFAREPESKRKELLAQMRGRLTRELSPEALALVDASFAEWFGRVAAVSAK